MRPTSRENITSEGLDKVSILTDDIILKVFADKLASTGSMDEAIGKAIWVSYNEGLLAGLKTDSNKGNIINEVKRVLVKAYKTPTSK